MLMALVLTSLTAACGNPSSGDAICEGSLAARRDLAATAAASDDMAVKRSAVVALEKIAAGC
jgi:hypothetical protein